MCTCFLFFFFFLMIHLNSSVSDSIKKSVSMPVSQAMMGNIGRRNWNYPD